MYLTVDFIIPSKLMNVQLSWILLIYRDRENGVTLFKLLSKYFMCLRPYDNVLTSELDFVQNNSCTGDGEEKSA